MFSIITYPSNAECAFVQKLKLSSFSKTPSFITHFVARFLLRLKHDRQRKTMMVRIRTCREMIGYLFFHVYDNCVPMSIARATNILSKPPHFFEDLHEKKLRIVFDTVYSIENKLMSNNCKYIICK